MLYRAARYIFQYTDEIDQNFCLPDMRAGLCPYSTYSEGKTRDPDICAKCLIGHFKAQEQDALPFAGEP